MSKPPNFILFITDQQRADFLGCYGHPVLRTPHIDSIAAKGTLFGRFYVASPVCMPNRASLMTGRMPSVHGVRSNGIPLSMQAVTFVELLRDSGYRTALIGKSHLQNFTAWPPIVKRAPPCASYREPSRDLMQALRNDLNQPAYEQETPEYWSLKDARIQTPFYGFDRVSLVRTHGEDGGGDYTRWLTERDPNAKALLGHPLPHEYTLPQAYRTAIPAELYPTAFIGDHLGDHRLLLKGAEKYQSIVRVPFIWCDPQAADNPAVADTLASTLDISATVLDRARIEPFSGIQGISLLPALRGAGAVRESVFIQYDHQHPSPGTNVPPRVHSLIDRRYRISVFHGTGWGELYDLQADPGEFENLWEDPAHASIRAQMVEQLLMAEIEHVDRVPLPTRRA